MAEQNNWKHLVQEKMSRRNFLRGLSAAGVGAAASSVLPTGVLAAAAPAISALATAKAQAMGLPFAPTEPTDADDVTLPEGYSYQVVIKRGDVFTKDGKTFGDNADWTGWYPIDGLEGGNSAEEGLLVVNNEYLNEMLVSGYVADGETAKTPEQILLEKESVGFAVVHLRKVDGAWTIVTDSDFGRRFDATTPIQFVGPVAGADVVGGATEVIGTLGNCSGGQTPWMTALSCEENYQSYYGEDSVNEPNSVYKWEIETATAQPPEHYGWVVEADPYTGTAKKLTALGRFRHENVAIGIGASGKVVAYMGDDSRDECVYKFISDGTYDPNNRDANLGLLETGTLYAANFSNGTWIPLVFEGNEERLSDPGNVGGYTIANQADLLTYVNLAARALGATRTDRPEDIEIHPQNGDVYIAFTNNSNHGNFHGQITRIIEAGGDHEALEFGWDIFAVGGPQSGFSSPDNLIFDNDANLWVVTDVSSGSLNGGIYSFMGNNALFYIPTSGDNVGKAFRFASGPVEAEMTGPTFLGNDTLFLSVQHPGEESESAENLSSHWPEGGDAQPRAGVVAIVGPFSA
jgi:secreted PhoX family phosphatase